MMRCARASVRRINGATRPVSDALSDDFAMPMHDQRGLTRQAERHSDIVERERVMQRDQIRLPRSLGENEGEARCDRGGKQCAK